MNRDANRNTRTLIVSFVLVVMVLIPLRFVEVGQSNRMEGGTVLGESVSVQEVKLEAPYDKIDGGFGCVLSSEADKLMKPYLEQLRNNLSSEEASSILSEVQKIESLRCN